MSDIVHDQCVCVCVCVCVRVRVCVCVHECLYLFTDTSHSTDNSGVCVHALVFIC